MGEKPRCLGARIIRWILKTSRSLGEVIRDDQIPVVANPEEGSEWAGRVGLVTEAVQQTYPDLSKHEGYLCGSPGMIDAAAAVFTGLGMPEDKIYYDKFS